MQKYTFYYFERGMSSDEATKDVIEIQIPEVVKLNNNGELDVENLVAEASAPCVFAPHHLLSRSLSQRPRC